jgi:hypothetical protein
VVTSAWLLSPVYSVVVGIGQVEAPGADLGRRTVIGRVLRHGRDYGIHMAALPVAIVVGGWAVLAVMTVIAALDLLFLAMRIYTFGFLRS